MREGSYRSCCISLTFLLLAFAKLSRIKMYHLSFDTHEDYLHAISLLEDAGLEGVSTHGPPLTIQVDTLDVMCGVLLRLLPQGINVYIQCV